MKHIETTRKEHPILFSAPMVRALLAGTKTQTRREAIKCSTPGRVVLCDFDAVECLIELENTFNGQRSWKSCPYGKPGDRLWVREAFQGPLIDDDAIENPDEINTPKYCFYAADGGSAPEFMTADDELRCCWRPSIHMPRWASRIILEITGVRVERLQDISEADAIAEGCTQNHNGYFWGGPHKVSGQKQMATAVKAYADLWESINGPGSWDANPWVWCVSFQVLKVLKAKP